MKIENLSIASKNILIMQAIRLDSKNFRYFLDLLFAAKHNIVVPNFLGMFFRLKLINDICNNANISVSEQNVKQPTLKQYFEIEEDITEVIEKIKTIVTTSLPNANEDDYQSKELESMLNLPSSYKWRYNLKSNLSQIEKDEWILDISYPGISQIEFIKTKEKIEKIYHDNDISPIVLNILVHLSVGNKPQVFRRLLDRAWRAYDQSHRELLSELLKINAIIFDHDLSILTKTNFAIFLKEEVFKLLTNYDDGAIKHGSWFELLNIIAQVPKPSWRKTLAPRFESEVPLSANTGQYSNADEFKTINLNFDIKNAQQHDNYNEAIITAVEEIYSCVSEDNSVLSIINILEKTSNICPAHIAFIAVLQSIAELYLKNNFSKDQEYALVRSANTIRDAIKEYTTKFSDPLLANINEKT
ncbi:MAG: hypothetical protein HON32_06735 [Francisellaceae bacterium]|nr:hypothetical protein [Francisellaceae bacterium]